MEKQCSKCLEVKEINLFPSKGRICKSCISLRKRQEYLEKRDSILEGERLKRQDPNFREKMRKRTKDYYLRFPEKKKEVDRKFYEKRKKQRIKRQNERAKERRKSDPMFRAIACLRSRLGMALNDWHKSRPTQELLGCSKEELKIHLELQFLEGMSWENHGIGKDKWHIDHKIPLSSAKTLLELETLFHYSNLQPLWSTDNIRKSNKI